VTISAVEADLIAIHAGVAPAGKGMAPPGLIAASAAAGFLQVSDLLHAHRLRRLARRRLQRPRRVAHGLPP
jgi:hypothetical protein